MEDVNLLEFSFHVSFYSDLCPLLRFFFLLLIYTTLHIDYIQYYLNYMSRKMICEISMEVKNIFFFRANIVGIGMRVQGIYYGGSDSQES